MAKLDWGKAAIRILDPARVQRTADFTTPDTVVGKKGAKRQKPASPSIWETALIAIAKACKKRDANKTLKVAKSKKARKAVARPKSKPVAKTKQEAPRLTEEERHAEPEARGIARAAHQERYLDKASKQQAAMAAKKKTHLQAWIEEQSSLQTDRESLHQQWRNRLLRRPEQE